MVNTEVCVLQMMPKNVGVIVLAMKISPENMTRTSRKSKKCVGVASELRPLTSYALCTSRIVNGVVSPYEKRRING